MTSKPWLNEGDEPRRFTHAGLDCLVMRGPLGQWNGYVRVDSNHPFFGWSYNNNPSGDWLNNPECLITIHGGLTYAGGVPGVHPDKHTDDHLWWFGFDTAHATDIVPLVDHYPLATFPDAYYKDLDWVVNETKRLADQLAAVIQENPWKPFLQPQ
jgi:hypothetical protein